MNIDMEQSKIFQVRPGSPSLRGTVPQGIANALKLKDGDTLMWEVEARGGEIVAVVKKVKD